jgi:hypothetical protein
MQPTPTLSPALKLFTLLPTSTIWPGRKELRDPWQWKQVTVSAKFNREKMTSVPTISWPGTNGNWPMPSSFWGRVSGRENDVEREGREIYIE